RYVVSCILASMLDGRANQSGVAILPNIQIGLSEGAPITDQVIGCGLYLTGGADYVMFKYLDNKIHQNRSDITPLTDALSVSQGMFLLVVATILETQAETFSIPEAVGQTIALANLSGLSFLYISSGTYRKFFVLTIANGIVVYHASVKWELKRYEVSGASKEDLKKVVCLLYECVNRAFFPKAMRLSPSTI
ncbi:hypothetical protein BKA70DRAFT_1129954, partial [Coprinopsis sp. MPI-PUGE-AT-0042]